MKHALLAAIASVALFTALPAQAAAFYWDTASGNWTTNTNWWTTAGGPANPAGSPVAGSTITFNGTGVNGAETIYLNGNQASALETFANTGTTTLLGGISGTPADNTLTLSGGLTINIGAGAVTLGDTSGSPTAEVNLVLTANQSFTNNSSGLLTIANGITSNAASGTQTLTIAGTGAGGQLLSGIIGNGGTGGTVALTINAASGSTTLGAANTYTGLTTVTAGTLKISVTNGIKSGNALTTGASGIFDLNGNAQTLGALTNGGNVTNSGSIQTLTFGAATASSGSGSFTGAMNVIINNGTAASTLSGSWSNTGTITNSGAGAGGVTLSGNIGSGVGLITEDTSGSSLTLSGTNTNVDGVTLTLGKLILGSTTALGATASTLNIAAGSLDSSVASLVLANNNAQNWNGSFTFVGTDSLNLGSGAVAIGSGVMVTTTANTLTAGGTVTDSGNGLTKAGAGTLALTGNNSSTYTGATTINAGTLSFGNNSLGSGSATITLAGGTLQYAAAANTQDVGARLITTGGSTANIDVNDNAVTFANPLLAANLAGTGGLALFSSTAGGSLTLNGANTYTGNTTVNSGTLILGSGATIAGNIVTAGTGTFDLDGNNLTTGLLTNGGNVTNSNATTTTLTIGNGSVGAGSFTGKMNVIWNQGATATALTGNWSNTGNITINTNGSATARLTTGTVNNTGTITTSGSSTGIAGIYGNIGANVQGVIQASASSLTLEGANTFTSNVTITSGFVLADPTAADISGTSTALGLGNIVFNGGYLAYGDANVADYSTRFKSENGNAIILSGGGFAVLNGGIDSTNTSGLTLNGLGGITLNGTNSYTGTTWVDFGGIATVLNLGNAAALSSGALKLTDGTINNTSGSPMTITDGFEVSGDFDFTLNNNLTFSGNGTLDGLRILTVNAGGVLTLGGTLSDGTSAGGFTKSGAGTLVVTGNNTFTGGFGATGGILNGVLSINSMAALGTGTGVIAFGSANGGGQLTYTGTGDTTTRQLKIFNTAVGGLGPTIDQSGTGLLNFNSGTALNNQGVASTNELHTLTLQGSTAGTGEISEALVDATNGNAGQTALSVVKAGTGTWILSDTANTFSGAVAVNNGTLSFATGNVSATAAQSLGENVNLTLGVASTSSGTLQYFGTGPATLAKGVTAQGNGGDTIQNSGTGLLTLSGGLVKNGTTLTLNGGGSGINVTGVISGGASNSDMDFTGGTTTLSTLATYNGPTWIYGGGDLINNVSGGALPTGTSINIGTPGAGGVATSSSTTAGTFDLGGNNQTVAGLNTEGTGPYTSDIVTNSVASSPHTLTVTGGGTFAGIIQDGVTAGNTALTVSGGTLTLSGANTYTGATQVNSGTLSVTGSLASGSAVTVGGSTASGTPTLNGTGTIGGNVVVSSSSGGAAGTLASGGVQTSDATHDTVTGTGLTLSSNLSVNGGAKLTFALGAGASTGYLAYSTPNLNSTYLTANGTVAFGTTGGAVNISLVDLTAFSSIDTLQLRNQNPYLLIAAGGLDSNYDLVTSGGYDQNGLVLGIGSSGTGNSILNTFSLSAQDINGGALSNPYNNLQLYLYNGDLEVVPEPSTWALMIGGLALLVFWQRRKRHL